MTAAPPRHDAVLGLSSAGFHRIAFTDWGERDNPHVVICAHGLTRNGRDFDVLAARLSRRARVICPDIAGRGASDWLPDAALYGYPQYLADMAALIARVSAEAAVHPDGLRLDWVGTSMGGLIGMMLAAAAGTPVRRLVMNDIGPVLAKEGLTRIGAYAGADPRFDSMQAFSAWLGPLLKPWGAGTPALPDSALAGLIEHSARRFTDAAGRTCFGAHYDPAIAAGFKGKTFDRDIEMWPIWHKVVAPALVLRGQASEIFRADTARQMAQRAAPTTVLEFAGIGHAPALVNEEQMAPIERFLFE
jgi:pimeloyl-ACP methyl ester carboxylesterase